MQRLLPSKRTERNGIPTGSKEISPTGNKWGKLKEEGKLKEPKQGNQISLLFILCHRCRWDAKGHKQSATTDSPVPRARYLRFGAPLHQNRCTFAIEPPRRRPFLGTPTDAPRFHSSLADGQPAFPFFVGPLFSFLEIATLLFARSPFFPKAGTLIYLFRSNLTQVVLKTQPARLRRRFPPNPLNFGFSHHRHSSSPHHYRRPNGLFLGQAFPRFALSEFMCLERAYIYFQAPFVRIVTPLTVALHVSSLLLRR